MWSAATACLSGCLTTHPLALMDTVLVGQHMPGLSINRDGSVVALRVDGKKAIRTSEVEVRRLPEGAVFGQNSRHLDVGNFINQDITILRVGGDQLANTAR